MESEALIQQDLELTGVALIFPEVVTTVTVVSIPTVIPFTIGTTITVVETTVGNVTTKVTTEVVVDAVDTVTTTTTVVTTVTTIFGISQQRISEVSDSGSPFAVVANTYSFLTSKQNIDALPIVGGAPFTMQIFNRLFAFEFGSYTEDLTGWVELFATMTGVTDV
jgi:hypothetical protein